MSHFPDTSFLCALYRAQVNSPSADAYMAGLEGPLTISSLLILEFRQSIRFQVHLNNDDRTKGFPLPEGRKMLRDFQLDLNSGVLSPEPVDWADAHQRAETLSSTYTIAAGHRLADILHVATALHLGAAEFLTFDANQRILARAEGLAVPLP
jgi:predicted nucleic acid-binding protein